MNLLIVVVVEEEEEEEEDNMPHPVHVPIKLMHAINMQRQLGIGSSSVT